RPARGRAEEVRQGQGPPVVPVLQALAGGSASRRPAALNARQTSPGDGTPPLPGASVEIGVYTFAGITTDLQTGRVISHVQGYREILDAAKLAEEAGLTVFGVGEHHRLDIAIASPAIVMAAVATITNRLRLTSAVTILSTLDPVRVFQDFATV